MTDQLRASCPTYELRQIPADELAAYLKRGWTCTGQYGQYITVRKELGKGKHE